AVSDVTRIVIPRVVVIGLCCWVWSLSTFSTSHTSNIVVKSSESVVRAAVIVGQFRRTDTYLLGTDYSLT
ncbi:MAG TPA: hypothetical protein VJ248_08670, partial [Candidatus Udaeobacter sp.]|nr:hypothetical protein [Candidatus Udaeobacter sp.]